jgi:putative pyruvate formate lyase activating enzyme
MKPAYLNISQSQLKKRSEKAWQLLNPCRVCPRKCGVDRAHDEKQGFCRTGSKPKVYSAHPHFGEESCLVGTSGSGTIFFSSCNLACIYCQNWEISQLRLGQEIEFNDLTEMMLSLQTRGCHNINFVSPTIWVPQILKALLIARDKGLNIPLVYNTGGYDAIKTLKLLDGIVDIYMPDIKYSDSKIALKYSLVPNYWQVNKKAIKEMYRQVGDLNIDKNGLATKGLLVRHLVLPDNLAGTKKVMKFLSSISKNTFVNIMDQYHPTNKANLYTKINRRITAEEFEEAIESAEKMGLHRFDKREPRAFLKFL